MMFRVPLGCPPGSSLPVITPEGIPLLITIPHDSFSWQEISLSYSVFYASHYVSASARNPANKTIDIITQDKLKMKVSSDKYYSILNMHPLFDISTSCFNIRSLCRLRQYLDVK